MGNWSRRVVSGILDSCGTLADCRRSSRGGQPLRFSPRRSRYAMGFAAALQSRNLAYMNRVLDRVCELDDNRHRRAASTAVRRTLLPSSRPVSRTDARRGNNLYEADSVLSTASTLHFLGHRFACASALMSGDAQIPGGTFVLGASRGAFVSV